MGSVALLLRKDPDDILEWTESKFALWSVVLLEQYRAMAADEAQMVAMAMWDPKALQAFITGGTSGSTTGTESLTPEARQAEAARALARAQEIMALPASGAHQE